MGEEFHLHKTYLTQLSSSHLGHCAIKLCTEIGITKVIINDPNSQSAYFPKYYILYLRSLCYTTMRSFHRSDL